MPNYRISNCLLGTPIEFVISATSLSIGQIVSVNQSETIYCGQVIEETELTTDAVFGTENLNCCECLSDNYESFIFKECFGNRETFIDITTFCNTYTGPPTFINNIWRLYDNEIGESWCAEFSGPSILPGTTLVIPDEGPFASCDSCSTGTTTYTAGTEYTVCVICEDCCQSGTTATTINPPHPTWTRPDGDAVVLLDAVALGGMFGLNN